MAKEIPPKRVGEFVITSGAIEISDPCYSGGDNQRHPAANGKWVAYVEFSDEGQLGIRVSSLIAYLDGSPLIPTLDAGCVGVDSGQMAISDAGRYSELTSDLYDEVCEKNRPCAIIEGFAAVSETGFGDGGYPLLLGVNDQGYAVSVSVVFIGDYVDGE